MSKYSEFGPAIGHCSNFKGEIVNDNTESPSINYTWTDPAEEGIPYGGTILAIKEGSAPVDSTDGYIVDTMDKDKYKTEAYSYQVSSTPGAKDIYATLFPYSANKSVNELKKHVLKSAVTVAAKQRNIVKKSSLAFPPKNGTGTFETSGMFANGKYRFVSTDSGSQFDRAIYTYDESTNTVSKVASFPSAADLGISDYSSSVGGYGLVHVDGIDYMNIGYTNTSSKMIYVLIKYDGASFNLVANTALDYTSLQCTGIVHFFVNDAKEIYRGCLAKSGSSYSMRYARLKPDDTFATEAVTSINGNTVGQVLANTTDGFTIVTSGYLHKFTNTNSGDYTLSITRTQFTTTNINAVSMVLIPFNSKILGVNGTTLVYVDFENGVTTSACETGLTTGYKYTPINYGGDTILFHPGYPYKGPIEVYNLQ